MEGNTDFGDVWNIDGTRTTFTTAVMMVMTSTRAGANASSQRHCGCEGTITEWSNIPRGYRGAWLLID